MHKLQECGPVVVSKGSRSHYSGLDSMTTQKCWRRPSTWPRASFGFVENSQVETTNASLEACSGIKIREKRAGKRRGQLRQRGDGTIPPYSVKWAGDTSATLADDPRFSPAGRLAPKNNADLAFVMHSLSWLANDGVAAMLTFPGALYRQGAEQVIRQYLVDNDYVLGPAPVNAQFRAVAA